MLQPPGGALQSDSAGGIGNELKGDRPTAIGYSQGQGP